MSFVAETFYKTHYAEVISKALTEDVKLDIANRISGLTLKDPIWLNREKDFIKDFPELKPFINVKLTGLYLCGIMAGIIDELQGGKTNCPSR